MEPPTPRWQTKFVSSANPPRESRLIILDESNNPAYLKRGKERIRFSSAFRREKRKRLFAMRWSENEKKGGRRKERRIHRKTNQHARVRQTGKGYISYGAVVVVLPRLDDNCHV